MIDKNIARLRRAKRSRKFIKELGVKLPTLTRLTVFRSNQHIYAQIFSADGASVLASASTLDKDIKAEGAKAGNIAAANIIGRTIAKRAEAAGITKVAFDRSGFKYHGCIKALADAAREAGLEF